MHFFPARLDEQEAECRIKERSIMKRTKTFEYTYNYFAPGTLVRPTSPRCSLEDGMAYKVTRCIEPMYAGDKCVIFVEGRKTGVSTEYLTEVDEDDLSWGIDIQEEEI